MQKPKKLILAVIDALAPAALDQAVAAGSVPILAEAISRGHYSRECISVFPSVTPVCAASIATGRLPQEHRVPSMNWYHRAQHRYVEYGSSFSASRATGISRSLTDTVYNLNLSHLSPTVNTIFESLDDAGGIRTAGTTYLIVRGRYRHEPSRESSLVRLATSTLFRHAVYGPRELFYADLFSSRSTGCSAQLGAPGVRDAHSGCVSEYMAQHDLYDFLLLSLPDNDTHSHRYGPQAQVESVAAADRQIARIAEAVGGVERFFETHALVVLADHAQSQVRERFVPTEVLADYGVLPVDEVRRVERDARIAVCPNARAGSVYLLDQERDYALLPRIEQDLLSTDQVDLTFTADGEWTVARKEDGELRFKPGGKLHDLRGGSWTVAGDLELLTGEVDGQYLNFVEYPNALERVHSAVCCRTGGNLLFSLKDGAECADWGGSDHVGGGSHGALLGEDSLAPLIYCGLENQRPQPYGSWSITDPARLVRDHFAVTA